MILSPQSGHPFSYMFTLFISTDTVSLEMKFLLRKKVHQLLAQLILTENNFSADALFSLPRGKKI